MTATCELRWFFDGDCPAAVRARTAELGSALTEERTDHYLLPGARDDLSIKLRAGRLEVKQRTAVGALLRLPGARGRVELWRKWAFLPADADLPTDWLPVHKRRALWPYAPEPAALHAELTELTIGDGRRAWTIGLEAGGDGDREAALRRLAEQLFGRPFPVALTAARACGYPRWLRLRTPLP